jgi:hypothetical protein
MTQIRVGLSAKLGRLIYHLMLRTMFPRGLKNSILEQKNRIFKLRNEI